MFCTKYLELHNSVVTAQCTLTYFYSSLITNSTKKRYIFDLQCAIIILYIWTSAAYFVRYLPTYTSSSYIWHRPSYVPAYPVPLQLLLIYAIKKLIA